MPEQPAPAVRSVFHRPERRRRTEPTLSRERIVAATVALLDREGSAALTMRKVAAELDAHATSLYWYVERREDLVDLAVDEILATAARDLPGPETPWDEALTETARRFYAALTAHSWAAEFSGSRPLIGPNALALSKRILTALREAGGTEEEQAVAATAISNQILGAATTAAAIRAMDTTHPDGPAPDVAATLSAPQALVEWSPLFDEVLALIIDGIRVTLGR